MDFYRYKGVTYIKVFEGLYKTSCGWTDCVIYMDPANREVFVRDAKDFAKKFKAVA